ncbi:MAG: ATP-binding cassette domain-containing protein [bacterium]
MHIRIENLTFRYTSLGARPEPALRDVNLDIRAGEFLALVGLSGSGKTTLMQHLTGLLKPDSGRVLVDGQDLAHKQTSLTAVRRRIGLVFQFPESQFFEDTVFDDVAFGPRNLGLPERDVRRRVQEALQSVALNFEEYKTRSPFQLSDGEKRRAAIAGVLALEPECLALDEPTAGLDLNSMHAVTSVLQACHARGATIVLISHNLDWVASVVKRVVILKQGRVHFDGTKESLFANPTVLQQAGLSLPRTRLLVEFLKQRGWLNTDRLYTLDEIKQALREQQSSTAPQSRNPVI